MLTEWLTEFRRAAGDLRRQPPLVMALATTDAGGAPRARSVVCRHVTDDGGLWFASDARSEKNAHLRRRPEVEAVAWLAGSREQFRFFGRAELLTDGGDRLDLLRELSDASRAMFFWPDPGRPRTADTVAFPRSITADTPPPASFEVIVVRPIQVEHLALTGHPHRRRRWCAETGWRGEELNP